MKKTHLLLPSLLLAATAAQAQQVVSFSSTDRDYWRMGTSELASEGQADVVIDTSADAQQTFKGWGTCFNELDWITCQKMSQADQDAFHERLFSPNGDLKMNMGRISIGASDYGASWYSLDETDGNVTDFEMEHFNIDRDLTCVIPSIKEAQKRNPDMTFWASPWSPPQWMKTNKHYAQRPTSTNGCPFGVPPYDNDQFICEDAYFNAYCLYFDKFIEAYKAQGIPVTTLSYQNEAYSNTPYPGCSWKAETTGKFLAQYLGPYMAEHQPDLKLIFGTCNTNHWDVYTTGLGVADIEKYVDIIGLQWEGGQLISRIRSTFPQYELWQTESECGSGTFDWSAAAHTFQLINHYLGNGVTAYTYWNAILDNGGYSTWGWKQNSLVYVSDDASHTPTYTPEYYAFKHYSHLITPGSTILKCDENNLLLSAKTPEGAIIVVVGNSGGMSKRLTVEVDGKFLTAVLPGNSFRSYVIADDALMASTLKDEAQSLLDNHGALSADQREALTEALTDGSLAALEAALKAALGETSDAEALSDGKIVDAAFQQGGTNWYVDTKAGSGDFKITTKAGRLCWNSWSNDFSSMDIHQRIVNLPAGEYKLKCYSMTADEALADQHLYASVGGETYVSPNKQVGGIDVTWEEQQTGVFSIAEGDTLTVGYASTSGGGTTGWFCVTGFQLVRCVDGEETTFNVVEAGTTTPSTSGTYYLYDITRGMYVQVGTSDLCGVLSYEPQLTFFPKETEASAGYYAFCTSVRSDQYFKSGYWNSLYTWFDGTSDVATARWYLTPSGDGVKLDVGQYDDGGTQPVRTDSQKYYLYYNGSVMAFTSDPDQADEFIFIDTEAYDQALTHYYTYGGAPAEVAVVGDLEPASIAAAGTVEPAAGTAYYLYDITREQYVQVGSADRCGLLSQEPSLTFTAQDSDADYRCFTTSFNSSKYFKSGYWNNLYTWFDGAASDAVSQWYLTPSGLGVKLDVGQYDNGGTNPVRTDSQKYYLYYNGSVMAFTTDAAQADEFVFLTPAAYEQLARTLIIDESTRNLASTGTRRPVKVVRRLADGLNTLYLPFDLSQEEVAAAFGSEAKVYQLSGATTGESGISQLSFDAVSEVRHSRPVLVAPSADRGWTGEAYTFGSKPIAASRNADAANGANGGVRLEGVYQMTDVPVGDFLLSGGKLAASNGQSVSVGPTRAYFHLTGDPAVQGFEFSLDGDGLYTSISDVRPSAAPSDSASSAVFDLSGRKVADRADRLPHGIYVVGGQKVVR